MTTQPRSPGTAADGSWLPRKGPPSTVETTVSVGYRKRMIDAGPDLSPRRDELLKLAYRYGSRRDDGAVAAAARNRHGLEPTVLLFLFGSQAADPGVPRARAGRRARPLEAGSTRSPRTAASPPSPPPSGAGSPPDDRRGAPGVYEPGLRPILVERDGPWAHFARATVEDWVALLATAQPPEQRGAPQAGVAERTLVLAGAARRAARPPGRRRPHADHRRRRTAPARHDRNRPPQDENG